MSIRKKIELIIEERQAEAAKKDITRKLKAIVRVLGYEVRSESGGTFEGGFGYFQSELDENWDWSLENNDDDLMEMPISDLEANTLVVLRCYDGLSNGVNFQINYDENNETISASYDGNKVYTEVRGKLKTYVPLPVWEKHVDSLFSIAERRAKIKDEEASANQKQEKQGMIQKVLEHLQKNWGI